MLQLSGVTATRVGVPVLEGIDLRVEQGSAVGVVGPAGVGKSTLLDSIAGRVTIASGQILLGGRDASSWSTFQRARWGVRLVRPSHSLFPNLTVAQHFALVGVSPDTGTSLLNLLEGTEERRASELSGGMQRVLSVALSFAAKARLLLIDDFAEGLQPVVVAELVARLRAHDGRSLVIVDRSIEVLQGICDVIIGLRHRKVAYECVFPWRSSDIAALRSLMT